MDLPYWLPLIWSGIIAFAVFMYVLMDGFDLGIGILFPFVPDAAKNRASMIAAIAPVWDGNETWLVMGGAALLAAFPVAYSVILPAMYLPIFIMLVALVFRGVAFEFRVKAERSLGFWNMAFHAGSLIAALSQGLVLGSYVQGFTVANRQFVGGPFDWLTPFSIATAFGVAAGHTLLGASWLALKTEGALYDWAKTVTGVALLLVMIFMGVVSLWVPFLETKIAARWFAWPNIAFLAPVPLATLFVAWRIYRAAKDKHGNPFRWALALFALGYLGLGISLWPNVVPPGLTIWDASSPVSSQLFLLAGMAFLLPAILGYTAWSYWIFRGKIDDKAGYH